MQASATLEMLHNARICCFLLNVACRQAVPMHASHEAAAMLSTHCWAGVHSMPSTIAAWHTCAGGNAGCGTAPHPRQQGRLPSPACSNRGEGAHLSEVHTEQASCTLVQADAHDLAVGVPDGTDLRPGIAAETLGGRRVRHWQRDQCRPCLLPRKSPRLQLYDYTPQSGTKQIKESLHRCRGPHSAPPPSRPVQPCRGALRGRW